MCGVEGIINTEVSPLFRAIFANDNDVTIADVPLTEFLSPAVVVINENCEVIHTEQVGEIVKEPDYKALAVEVTPNS